MSTATRKLEHATFATFTVETGQVSTEKLLMQLSASGVRLASAGSDTIIGVARSTQIAGERVDITLFSHIEAMTVGTGGATAGAKQLNVATGVTDATAHDSDGTTNEAIVGTAMQTAVATAVIGVMMTLSSRGA